MLIECDEGVSEGRPDRQFEYRLKKVQGDACEIHAEGQTACNVALIGETFTIA